MNAQDRIPQDRIPQDRTPPNRTLVWGRSQKAALAGILLVQFAAAYFIGAGSWLTNDGHSLAAPIALTAAFPVVLFLAAYAVSMRFRGFVLAQDIRTLTMMQLWRVVGFVFLPLYAFAVLPGLFAWPAGLGDVAIGLAAILVVARLDRDPHYLTTSGFLWFNFLGLFDFAVAIATSGLAAGAFPELISNGVTSAALDVWPMNVFPSFIVPAFIILHLTVLLNVRELRRSARRRVSASLQTA